MSRVWSCTDWTRFQQELLVGVRTAFKHLREMHADEHIYGYAVYLDDGAMTVCAAANTEKALVNEDDPAYRWLFCEWQLCPPDETMSAAAKMLADAVTVLKSVSVLLTAINNTRPAGEGINSLSLLSILLKSTVEDEDFDAFRTALFEGCTEV